MPSRQTSRVLRSVPRAPAVTRATPRREATIPNFYPDPWTTVDGAPIDRIILAHHRASQLAALVVARLEMMSRREEEVLDDGDLPLGDELEALSLVAIQIRHLLADATRLAGAYA